MSHRRGALAGVLASVIALSITSIVDALVVRVPSLTGSVGQAFLRAAPGSVAKLSIRLLGHADKPALRIGTSVLAIVIGATAGAGAVRRRWVGGATFTAFGALGVGCVASLPGLSVP